MPNLDTLQREFFRALLLPLRGTSRDSTELSSSNEGHSPEFFQIADDIIKPGPSLTSAERLELYHRQYWFRILDSLAEDFPVLRKMAGDEMFWQLIEVYLLKRPSQSFTLRHLGEAFQEFIETSELLDATQQQWFGSVARIEYAFMECFEAAQSALPVEDDLTEGVIELQNYVKLLKLPVEADLCWEWPDFSSASALEPQAIDVAVWREASGRSRYERIEAEEVPLLVRLQNGIRLDDLFNSLPDPAPSEEQITRWFGKWHSHRWLGVQGQEGKEELDPNGSWEGMDRMSSQAVSMD